MVSQDKKTSSSTRDTLTTWSPSSRNKKVAVFLTLFIAYELRAVAEAKPAANMNTSQNGILINKAGRYLTIGKHRIRGKYLYSPYGKNIHSLLELIIYSYSYISAVLLVNQCDTYSYYRSCYNVIYRSEPLLQFRHLLRFATLFLIPHSLSFS